MKKLTTLYSIILIIYGLNAQNQSFFKNQQFNVWQINSTRFMFENKTSISYVFQTRSSPMSQNRAIVLAEYNKVNGNIISTQYIPQPSQYINKMLFNIIFSKDSSILVTIYSTNGNEYGFDNYKYDLVSGNIIWTLNDNQNVSNLYKYNNELFSISFKENVLDQDNIFISKIDENSGEFVQYSFSSSELIGVENINDYFGYDFFIVNDEFIYCLLYAQDYRYILKFDKFSFEFIDSFIYDGDAFKLFSLREGFAVVELNNEDKLYNEVVFFDDNFQVLNKFTLSNKENKTGFSVNDIVKQDNDILILYKLFPNNLNTYSGLIFFDNNLSVNRNLIFDTNGTVKYLLSGILKSKSEKRFYASCVMPQNLNESFIFKTDTCGNVWSGNLNIFTQKDCGFVGVEDVIKPTESKIALYPNPNNGQFRMENEELGVVEVYNLQGQKVHSQRVNQINELINLNQPQSGVYLLRFIQENGTVKNAKFVVEN